MKRRQEPGRCSVCAKLIELCDCPWELPFEHWPPKLLRTVQALVAGDARED